MKDKRAMRLRDDAIASAINLRSFLGYSKATKRNQKLALDAIKKLNLIK